MMMIMIMSLEIQNSLMPNFIDLAERGAFSLTWSEIMFDLLID